MASSNEERRSSAMSSSSSSGRIGFLLLTCSFVWTTSVSQIRLTDAVSAYPLVMVVSLDGFWYGYLDRYKESTPNLRRLAEDGVRAQWVNDVFISKTFPNHFSIATGLYEESHGIVANEFYDPKLDDTFHLWDTDSKWWDTGAIPIWVLNQLSKPDRYSGGMMWPGTNASIKNQTAFHVVNYNKSMPWPDRVDTVIKWFTNSTHPANCVFLYIDEPDSTGHEFGPFSPEMNVTIKRVDNFIGLLRQKLEDANLFTNINIILTADHGMAEILPDHIINIDDILDPIKYKKYGNSPVWSIYPTEGFENEVYHTLKNASNKYNMKVYKKDDIPNIFHYKNNARIGPYILIAEDGYDFVTNNSTTHNKSYGNHGYNNSAMSMHPFFIAHGPAFKKGLTTAPFSSVDIYQLICYLSQLTPEPNNGSLINVIGMLDDPFNQQIPDMWLIGICSVLSLCILAGFVILAILNRRRRNIDHLDSGQYVYRSGKKPFNPSRESAQENQHLLLPSASEEI